MTKTDMPDCCTKTKEEVMRKVLEAVPELHTFYNDFPKTKVGKKAWNQARAALIRYAKEQGIEL